MTILVAYDSSGPAQKALQWAIDEHPEEEIVLLRVIEAADGSTSAGVNLAKEKLMELQNETETELSDEVTDLLDDDDIKLQMETVVGNPARETVAFAEENDIDHILVGSHGRSGVSRVLLGSVAEKIVRRAPVPVTVVR
ncbi:universal stress protein [Halostagnicola sp. A-GB9-2]|uniref:universal stress protein n=1 Tax=Halostagnicola sp. A-GB9-2 TaxID=3048066 RepID=UPI0024BF5180|nr:universal stress protein [Halostagnicola sp. A-GB9-2]MDJ1434528.1 universal stress protein [Halostagnicola sp. A-GB9-2]